VSQTILPGRGQKKTNFSTLDKKQAPCRKLMAAGMANFSRIRAL